MTPEIWEAMHNTHPAGEVQGKPAQQPAVVSVVIPLLSAEMDPVDAVESVLAQTHAAVEVILVSAGGALPPALARFGDKLKVMSCPPRSNAALARNIGTQAAKGNLVAFTDAAAVWHAQKLEKQIDYLLMHPEAALVHSGCTALVNGTAVHYVDKPARLTTGNLLEAGHLVLDSVLIRKEVMSRSGGFDTGFAQAEGYELAFRLVQQGYQLDFLSESLVHLKTDSARRAPFDWREYFVTHAGVVWRYRKYYRQHVGWSGLWQQLIRPLRVAGFKQPGLKGKLLRIASRVLYPFYIKT
jgi:glycosyltransferase involved in cell wall biosynthesis